MIRKMSLDARQRVPSWLDHQAIYRGTQGEYFNAGYLSMTQPHGAAVSNCSSRGPVKRKAGPFIAGCEDD